MVTFMTIVIGTFALVFGPYSVHQCIIAQKEQQQSYIEIEEKLSRNKRIQFAASRAKYRYNKLSDGGTNKL